MKNLENLVVALVRLYGAYSILTALSSLPLCLIRNGQLVDGEAQFNAGLGIVVWLIAKPLAAVVVRGLKDD